MPTGPNKEKRPADVVARAVMVAQIATGEKPNDKQEVTGKVRSGKAGAEARAKKLSPERRKEIAQKAAKARWGGRDGD